MGLTSLALAETVAASTVGAGVGVCVLVEVTVGVGDGDVGLGLAIFVAAVATSLDTPVASCVTSIVTSSVTSVVIVASEEVCSAFGAFVGVGMPGYTPAMEHPDVPNRDRILNMVTATQQRPRELRSWRVNLRFMTTQPPVK